MQKAHYHAPDASAVMIQNSICTMKETMKNVREFTSAIVNRHMEEVQKEFTPYFPAEGAMKRILQRYERKGQQALPESLDDVNINGKYDSIYSYIKDLNLYISASSRSFCMLQKRKNISRIPCFQIYHHK